MEVFDFMPYTYYTRMTVGGGKKSRQHWSGPIDTFTNPGTGAIIKSTQGKRIPFPYAFREKTAGESLGRRGSFHSGAAGEEPDGW
ncbi:hypothetical protein [Dialister succinatiphilus]|uniref:hypothetical protein n=2 Tax=Dialister succinatiphilus TaxID=487173 RepID=UPI00058EB04A|nr:hypothetical protein [Dialister succinatiphilus]